MLSVLPQLWSYSSIYRGIYSNLKKGKTEEEEEEEEEERPVNREGHIRVTEEEGEEEEEKLEYEMTKAA